MTRSDEILTQLQEVMREVLDLPDLVLTGATTARDVPGWDSIAMVNIILQAQKTFGIKFRSTEIDQLNNVGDFVARIEAKVSA